MKSGALRRGVESCTLWVMILFLTPWVHADWAPQPRPEKPEQILERAFQFERAQVTDCGEACGMVDTLYKALSILESDTYFDFDWRDSSKTRLMEDLRSSIDRLLAVALAADSGCVRAYLYLALPFVQRMPYSDSLLIEAKRIYRTGLRHRPWNPELVARLAYCLEVSDSLEAAAKLYARVARAGVERIDVPKALERLAMEQTLRQRFFAHAGESYIMLQRQPTYSLNKTTSYCRIWADGRCEYNEFFAGSDDPVYFERQIDSTQVDQILADLQHLGFLSLHHAFGQGSPAYGDFEYVRQWHLPVYRVQIRAGDFEHSIAVYGLGTIYGQNATQDVISITYVQDLNVPAQSHVMNKLGQLGEWWSGVFSLDWVNRRIDSLYSSHRALPGSKGAYRYVRSSDVFLKIRIPDLGVEWRATREERPRLNPADVEEGVFFEVEDRLYAYDGSWGRLFFVLPRNVTTEPYVRLDDWRLYFGGRLGDSLTLRVHSAESGRFLHALRSGPNGESPRLVEGPEISRHNWKDAVAELERLAIWLRESEK